MPKADCSKIAERKAAYARAKEHAMKQKKEDEIEKAQIEA